MHDNSLNLLYLFTMSGVQRGENSVGEMHVGEQAWEPWVPGAPS